MLSCRKVNAESAFAECLILHDRWQNLSLTCCSYTQCMTSFPLRSELSQAHISTRYQHDCVLCCLQHILPAKTYSAAKTLALSAGVALLGVVMVLLVGYVMASPTFGWTGLAPHRAALTPYLSPPSPHPHLPLFPLPCILPVCCT